MTQPSCKRTRFGTGSEDMDATTGNGSVEVQGLETNPDDKDCFIESEEFEQLLLTSAAFIDKTLFIKTFFEGSLNENSGAKKILITAPSQFGKSVIMNTLKVFCEPELDELGSIVTCLEKNAAGRWVEDESKTPPKNYGLFKTVVRNKPLQIYSCTCSAKHTDLDDGRCDSRQFFYQHCGQHPVIFFSLKDISSGNWSVFIKTFKACLGRTYEQHKYLGDDKQSRLSEHMKTDFNLFCEGRKTGMKEGEEVVCDLSEIDLQYSLKTLVEYLYIQFDRRVLVLVEELDAPLLKLLHASESIELAHIRKIIGFIGKMLGSVLKGNEEVLGALINSCSILSTYIFPYANNISICPFLENHHFSEYYGFTKAEVADLLETCNQDILLNCSRYKVLGTNLQLYNPHSVLKTLQDWKFAKHGTGGMKHTPASYFKSHGIDLLNKLFAVEGLRDALSRVITGTVTVNPVSYFTPQQVLKLKEVLSRPGEVDCEHADLFLQYMKDRGYFNIIEHNRNHHVYAIANGEATDEIINQFCDKSYYTTKYNISGEMIDTYTAAINDLDRRNDESFQKLADSVASLLSGGFKPKSHGEIKCVLYTFSVNEFERLCHENGKNPLDLLFLRKDGTGIIIEVKFGQSSARSGLQQIFDNSYFKVFEGENLTKDRIYIGLHVDDQKVTVCAFATSNEEVENFADIPEEKLIVKKSLIKLNCYRLCESS